MDTPIHASTPVKLSSMEIIKRRQNCRRLLFGVPNKQQLDEWLDRNEERHAKEARSKWNFDFTHGVPINEPDDLSSSTYEYEKIDAKTVPNFYRSPSTVNKLIEMEEEVLRNSNSKSSASRKKSVKSASVVEAKSPTKLRKKTTSRTVNNHTRQLNGATSIKRKVRCRQTVQANPRRRS